MCVGEAEDQEEAQGSVMLFSVLRSKKPVFGTYTIY